MPKIFVAGHNGMVGSAISRILSKDPKASLLTATRDEVDLTDQVAVFEFFSREQPDEVILAAAKVGGIVANDSQPVDFLYQNLQIQNNIITASHQHNVQKLLFLGSSCIYPKEASQPIQEKSLLTGPLEPTNEPYAIAKIAGIKLCESFNRQYQRDYRSVMPSNLYGPGDNYHLDHSHVIPGLIRRFHEAKVNKALAVEVWGSGEVRREFLHVDDMAAASLLIHSLPARDYQQVTTNRASHINVGFGNDITIRELSDLIRNIVGFSGEILFNSSKPDGVKRKLMDSGVIKGLGWCPKFSLEDGLADAYASFLKIYHAKRP